MSNVIFSRRWCVFGESVRGSSHERAGKPNQDACQVHCYDSERAAIAVVADGHGNRRSFRSDRGAKIAAEAVVQALDKVRVEYGARLRDDNRAASAVTLSELRGYAQSELPQRIVAYWQSQVDADHCSEPFSAAELAPLSEQEQASVSADHRTAYGSTVVAALLLADHALYLQLGDGDLLVVEDGGEEPVRPLPSDARSFANETASLWSPGTASSRHRPGTDPLAAWADFRVRVVPTGPDPPALVLLTTDGYVNAFVSDAGFRKVATDILAMGRTEGWEYVKQNLRGWLEEASRHGSGDDVTVAIMVRQDEHQVSGESPLQSPIAGLAEQSSISHVCGPTTERSPTPTDTSSNQPDAGPFKPPEAR